MTNTTDKQKKEQLRAKLRECSALLEKAKRLVPLRKGQAFAQWSSPTETSRRELIEVLEATSDLLESGKAPSDTQIYKGLVAARRLGANVFIPRFVEIEPRDWRQEGKRLAAVLDSITDEIEKSNRVPALAAQRVANALGCLTRESLPPPRKIILGFRQADAEDLRKMRSGEIDVRSLLKEQGELEATIEKARAARMFAKLEELESRAIRLLHLLRIARKAKLVPGGDLI